MCQLCAGGALTSAYLFDTLVAGKVQGGPVGSGDPGRPDGKGGQDDLPR